MFGSCSAATNMVSVATSPMPEARPSRPSTRLNALVQASSQNKVSGRLVQISLGKNPATPATRTPAQYARAAAANCPSNFCQGFNPIKSSVRPIAKISPAAGIIFQASGRYSGQQPRFVRKGIERDYVRNRDGNAAHPRNRVRVHFAPAVRLIDDAVRAENVAEDRRQNETHEEGLQGQPHQILHVRIPSLLSALGDRGVKT